MSNNDGSQPAGKHLRKVGIFAFLWSAMGCFDYLMTMTRNEAYMANFTPEQLDYFFSFPIWVDSAWAIAVWGGLLGAVLLLMRKKLAAPVFLASFVAMLVTSIHGYVLNDGLELMGAAGAAFSAAIFVFALGFYLYAKKMAEAGVLR